MPEMIAADRCRCGNILPVILSRHRTAKPVLAALDRVAQGLGAACGEGKNMHGRCATCGERVGCAGGACSTTRCALVPLKPKRTHCPKTKRRFAGTWPRHRALRHGEPEFIPGNVSRRYLEVQVLRNFTMIESQYQLEEATNSRSRLHMSEVVLSEPVSKDSLAFRDAPYTAPKGSQLNGIAQRSSGAMRLT